MDIQLQAGFDVNGGPAVGIALMGAEMTHNSWETMRYSAGDYVSTSEQLDLESLIPDDMHLVRKHINEKSYTAILARRDGTQLYMNWHPKSSLAVQVVSVDPATPRIMVRSILSNVPETQIEDTSVKLWLWYMGPHGPDETSKVISAPTWSQNRRNYPGRVASALDEIMKLEEPDNTGKIILWHGVPGTGKTNAIRTLMREWKDWCQFHYVADAEDLFKRPAYLMEVAVGDDSKWRLVIAEDADGMLRPDADNASGSGLGRLLNFSDGILGQGCNTIFLLTTNVRLDGLHPALTRPGRCLAQVEFTKFNYAEMTEWLPEDANVPADDKTLAELFEHINSRRVTNGLEDTSYGSYL